MSGLIGTLGGIAEIAKSAIGNDGGGAAASAKRPWQDQGQKA
jgi:hypothetical protein